MLYDLAIIGGGPAGASAAISATRRAPESCCWNAGDSAPQSVWRVVSAESLSLLKDLLDPQHAALIEDAVRIPRARIFLDGRTLQAAVNRQAASMARFDLDAALWHSAVSAGVDARQQVTVQSIAGTGPFRIDRRRRI